GRGRFRVRGDVVEVYPASADEEGIRLEFFGDEIDAITRFDPLTGHAHESLSVITFYPAKQFVTPADKLNRALRTIREELEQRIVELESQNKLLEAQRLRMRTEYDLEMLQEMGFCNGIENYSRHLSGRPPGSKPYTIIDFFPKDFLVVVDESHATIPQIGGMYEGDRSRKTVLVNYGFRLPSALDNRPLNFPEFMKMTNQIIYVSATPAEFEIKNSVVGNKGYVPHKRARIGEEELVPFILPGKNGGTTSVSSHSSSDAMERVPSISRTDQPAEQFDAHTPGAPLVIEQIIRPTGLLDPKITLKPLKRQIDDTIELCRERVEKSERVLVTTLTKRTAEDLADYLRDVGLKVRYLHSDIDTIERVEILRGLHTILRGREIAASVIQEAGGDFNVTELLRELEDEMQRASANLEFERAALLRDQIMEVKSGAGITKIEPKRRPVKYSRNAGRRRSRV